MTGILVSILIIIPALGIGNMTELYRWLLNLNSVVMPLRYLWVFVAFMLINKQAHRFSSDYKFVKNTKLGFGIGLWCLFTAFACILGWYQKLDYAADPKSLVVPIVIEYHHTDHLYLDWTDFTNDRKTCE